MMMVMMMKRKRGGNHKRGPWHRGQWEGRGGVGEGGREGAWMRPDASTRAANQGQSNAALTPKATSAPSLPQITTSVSMRRVFFAGRGSMRALHQSGCSFLFVGDAVVQY
jgi:hypothetical protein